MEKKKNNSLWKLYFESMTIPSVIFVIVLVVSLIFADGSKETLGYILAVLLLYIMVALRNLYIVMFWDNNKQNKKK